MADLKKFKKTSFDLSVSDNDDTVGFGKIVDITPTKLPNSYNDK